ncbi:hypothetical protein CRENBAI_018716 [Crenichthys baileyi]|uniref:Uncharacterized protein n=1 Tax=Crenichthys baileyi TaxID=28760 RepID=A0AAV9S0C6_9TELE
MAERAFLERSSVIGQRASLGNRKSSLRQEEKRGHCEADQMFSPNGKPMCNAASQSLTTHQPFTIRIGC